MAVSLIVPSYNSEKFIAATLESVLGQTLSDWELVVVNDGSTDQTGTIAETFARRDNRIRVMHQANAGLAAARNWGFAQTSMDYEHCMFLDSDDVLEPHALEILIQALEKDHDAVAAHGQVRFIDPEGKPLGNHAWPSRRWGIQGYRLKLWPASAPTTFAVLAYDNRIQVGGMMTRRAQQEAVGDFDKNTGPLEDWDMWLRLSRLGHIIFVDKVILAYRRHENNMSKNPKLMHEGALSVRKKIYTSPDFNEQEKRLINMGFRYHELSSAKDRFSAAGRKLSKRKWTDALAQLQLAMAYILSSMKGLTRA